jgi:DNA mismatch endonuclease, patch repair protein
MDKLPRVPPTAQVDDTGSWASSPQVRASMLGNKSRDTRPEKALRSAIHALGLRYRVGARPLPELRRTADVVFRSERIAVFLDGCFWHGCPEHSSAATSNSEYWARKITLNTLRDRNTDEQLLNAGWSVIRVWEHENPATAARRVETLVKAARNNPART